MKRIPTCHPENKYGGNGLCETCYKRNWYLDHSTAVQRRIPNRKASCHPDRKHDALGLCEECYIKLRAPVTKRRWHRATRYGITEEQFDSLALKQNGKCAICETKPERLAIDHDHKTGKVRGLLCIPCNAGLGSLRMM